MVTYKRIWKEKNCNKCTYFEKTYYAIYYIGTLSFLSELFELRTVYRFVRHIFIFIVFIVIN